MRTTLALICVALLGLGCCHSVLAVSPADLLWQPDARSRAEGGGDLPGQLSDRPEVRRPTSLVAATGNLLSLDYASQTPLRLVEKGAALGEWRSLAQSSALVMPLSGRSQASRWVLGLRQRHTSDRITYSSEGRSDRIALSDRDLSLALAWQNRAGWIVGAGVGREELNAATSGSALAKWLDLPPDSPDLPRLSWSALHYDLGISRELPRWRGGLQYSASRPDATLYVARRDVHYAAPLDVDTRRWEAYLAHRAARGDWFVTGWSARSHGGGTILAGLAARGDTDVDTRDSSLAVGWRKTRPGRPLLLMLDRRWSGFDTADQGAAGLVPGLFSTVYTLRGRGHVTTTSLRYGSARPLTGPWNLWYGVSAHYLEVNVDGRVRSVASIGSDPETIGEYHVADGVVEMVAVSLGPAYQTSRLTAALLVTGGMAWANDAFSGGPEEPGVKRESRQFRPLPLLTASVDYAF